MSCKIGNAGLYFNIWGKKVEGLVNYILLYIMPYILAIELIFIMLIDQIFACKCIHGNPDNVKKNFKSSYILLSLK